MAASGPSAFGLLPDKPDDAWARKRTEQPRPPSALDVFRAPERIRFHAVLLGLRETPRSARAEPRASLTFREPTRRESCRLIARPALLQLGRRHYSHDYKPSRRKKPRPTRRKWTCAVGSRG
jgi:hypothetical protein